MLIPVDDSINTEPEFETGMWMKMWQRIPGFRTTYFYVGSSATALLYDLKLKNILSVKVHASYMNY